MKSRRLKAASSRPRAAVDEHLLDARQRPQRLGTAGLAARPARRASRQPGAPGARAAPRAGARARSPRPGSRDRNTRPAGKQPAKLDARPRRPRRAGTPRLLQQQSAAVAGLAVAGDRATMGQAVEGRHRGLHQPVARLHRRGLRSARSRSCRARRLLCGVRGLERACLALAISSAAGRPAPRKACPAGCRQTGNSCAPGDPRGPMARE